jgi:hypothetical protein
MRSLLNIVKIFLRERMNRSTAFIFRIKCIMKKCRDRGKWDLLSRLAYKYQITTVGEKYYD